MEIIKQGEVPIYEATCEECKSTIRYIKSEVSFPSNITCPVCGCSIYALTTFPINTKE